jgi:hypothetical protein
MMLNITSDCILLPAHAGLEELPRNPIETWILRKQSVPLAG